MLIIGIITLLSLIFLFGIKVVSKTQSGSIEHFGKHKRLARPGIHWIIPIIEKIYVIDLKDQLAINIKLSLKHKKP